MVRRFNSNASVSSQIADIIRSDIFSGRYSPGQQIPTVRQLAMDIAVNPNTVQKALSYLEQDGLLIVKGTVGRFVTSDESIISAAKKAMLEDFMHVAIRGAAALGITKEEFIKYINESEGIL